MQDIEINFLHTTFIQKQLLFIHTKLYIDRIFNNETHTCAEIKITILIYALILQFDVILK